MQQTASFDVEMIMRFRETNKLKIRKENFFVYMLTFGGRDPSNGAELNREVLGILVNEMTCGSFGFHASRGVGGARSPYQRVSIGY